MPDREGADPAPTSFTPMRLLPGADLRRALEDAVRRDPLAAGFVVCGIGSLVQARLRFAGEPADTAIAGPLEIVSLAGSLSPDGAHLHAAVSDARGRVHGGHVGYGNVVRTTVELLRASLPQWRLSRDIDPSTGFPELTAIRRP